MSPLSKFYFGHFSGYFRVYLSIARGRVLSRALSGMTAAYSLLCQPIPRYPYGGMKLPLEQFLGRQLRHISGHSNIPPVKAK